LLQESDVDSIIESNPEMNDNQIAGLIYAELGSYRQNTTENNQGSGRQDQGSQGETGRAERTEQPAEQRTGQETGRQEQQSNQGVINETGGQPGTQPAANQGNQPTADGVVQPGGAGVDTEPGQDGASRGAVEPAVESTDPLTLDQEQDGTTPQSIDPSANELLWEAAQSPLTEPGTQSRFAGNPEMSGQGTANATQESNQDNSIAQPVKVAKPKKKHQPKRSTPSLFRETGRGGAVSVHDANKIVSGFKAGWSSGARSRVSVASTFADLPADVQQAAKEGGGNEYVRGVFHNDRFQVRLPTYFACSPSRWCTYRCALFNTNGRISPFLSSIFKQVGAKYSKSLASFVSFPACRSFNVIQVASLQSPPG